MSRSTQEVFDHHVEGFVARDVSMVLEDFDESSVVIANGETLRGLTGAREFFAELFTELPKDCAFELTSCIVLDKHVGPHARIWVPFLGLPAATARSSGSACSGR